MSCGKHHDTDCSEVLERMFFFIDNELPSADQGEIQQHLDECWPCLQKYDLERTVKTLVRRSCTERAPEGLRSKVLLQIRQVQVEITEASEVTRVTEVTETRLDLD
jgi:mycothiol system anti-sigma-R factor